MTDDDAVGRVLVRLGDKIQFAETGCWFWLGGTNRDGYGVVSTSEGRRRLTHRLSYQLAYGPIPRGLFVCHRCDRPACIRPGHLFLGTAADNMRDARRKGRVGQLSDERVREAIALHEGGTSLHDLARQWGVALAALTQRISEITSEPLLPDLDRELRAIPDPEERVVRAVAAHTAGRELVTRLSTVRREAWLSLHEAGYTWQQVADVSGVTVKAVLKVVRPSERSPGWWQRVDEEAAALYKLGPGGLPTASLLSRTELANALLEVMHEAEELTHRPRLLHERVEDRLGKEVSMQSLRSALGSLVASGAVAKVAHGRYALRRRRAAR